jgi:hypothetical protein
VTYIIQGCHSERSEESHDQRTIVGRT